MTVEKYIYKPTGVCSREFDFELENGRVVSLAVEGGCNGNLNGICSLVKGMPIDEVIARLEGIRCGNKPTSCPDQMSKALHEYLK